MKHTQAGLQNKNYISGHQPFRVCGAPMAKTYESRFPPSPKLDKVTVSLDKLNNTALFLKTYGVYVVNRFIKGTHKNNWSNREQTGQPIRRRLQPVSTSYN